MIVSPEGALMKRVGRNVLIAWIIPAHQLTMMTIYTHPHNMACTLLQMHNHFLQQWKNVQLMFPPHFPYLLLQIKL